MALSANPDAASPSTARCRTSVTFGGVLARHAVAFAKALIEARGRVSDAQFAAVKDTGWTDANIVEMIALTAQFLLTNFMNNAVQTPIAFLEVSPAKVA